MNPFDSLTAPETEAFLKFPVYISLLAANGDLGMDDTAKSSAIKFAHIKTFSCPPLLVNFYKEADNAFENNIKQLDNDLPKERDRREAAIRQELLILENILLKLGKTYISVMHKSMGSFKEHVSKAHHNVLVDFIFPVPIPGLTDE